MSSTPVRQSAPLILYSAADPAAEHEVKASGPPSCGSASMQAAASAGAWRRADKRCYLDWMFSPEDLDTMSLLRRLLIRAAGEPGKVLPTPAPVANPPSVW
ncbi:MAG: hypothetical protein CM15mP77_3920 [Synechococcus sp.]|nr:MAG: hypothetical protein CM15mP77_3920 [Synechococcus sp.]